MFYLLGILISIACMIASIFHLHQDLLNYFDVVGVMVVTGGTISVMVMTFPWHLRTEISQALGRLFLGHPIDLKVWNEHCFNFVRNVKSGQYPETHIPKTFAETVLLDGAEMIQLGIEAKMVESILDERIHNWSERSVRVSSAFRSLAKYPPAFGLVGTVFGLVSLMRAISTGSSSAEVGVRMGVALIATLYGLLISNLLLNPAGERILVMAQEERKAADIALKSVILAITSDVSLVESQEILNSFVASKDRLKTFNSFKAERGVA